MLKTFGICDYCNLSRFIIVTMPKEFLSTVATVAANAQTECAAARYDLHDFYTILELIGYTYKCNS